MTRWCVTYIIVKASTYFSLPLEHLELEEGFSQEEDLEAVEGVPLSVVVNELDQSADFKLVENLCHVLEMSRWVC